MYTLSDLSMAYKHSVVLSIENLKKSISKKSKQIKKMEKELKFLEDHLKNVDDALLLSRPKVVNGGVAIFATKEEDGV